MGVIFPESIVIDDPLFGTTNDDPTIANQMAQIALATTPGSLDEFPEYGFTLNGEILKGQTSTELAFVPLEMRTALEAEPSFTSAEVAVTTSQVAGGVEIDANCSMFVAESDASGFSTQVSFAS